MVEDYIRKCNCLDTEAYESWQVGLRWSDITCIDVHDVANATEVEVASVQAMARTISDSAVHGNCFLTGDSSGSLGFNDDDVAAIVHFARHLAVSNPIVSYWAFATTLRMHSGRGFHEATLFWLSASAAVVEVAMGMSTERKCACIGSLKSAVELRPPELQYRVLIPLYEIALRSVNDRGGPVSRLDAAVREKMHALFIHSLKEAVESEAVDIAHESFSMLSTLDAR